jgi:hypothetical protein
MASRGPVEPHFDTTQLRPTAAPVDTYVHPGVSQASQLAQALAQVDPKIGRFSEEWAQRSSADSHQKGIQAARDAYATGKKMGDLTREGSLPMQENAWFKAGLQEEMGRKMASDWNSDFTASLAQDPNYAHLKDSTELGDFDKAVEQHRADFLKSSGAGADEFFSKGFGGLSTEYMQRQRLEFANGIEKKLGDLSDATLHARTVQVIGEEMGKFPVEEIGKDLSTLASLSVNRGRPEKAVYSTMADAIDAAARQDPDPEHGLKLLELFHHVDGLGGGKLAQSKYGAELLEKAHNDLITQKYTGEMRAYEEKKRDDAAEADAWHTKLGEYMATNTMSSGSAIIAAAPARLKDDLITAASSLRSANESRIDSSDPRVIRSIVRKIFNPQPGEHIDVAAIANLTKSGGGVKGQDAAWLIGLYNTANSESGKGASDRLKKMPYFDRALSAIEDGFKDITTHEVPKENAVRVSEAWASFIYQAQTAIQNGAMDKLGENEQTNLLRDIARNIIETNTGALMDDESISPPNTQALRAHGGSASPTTGAAPAAKPQASPAEQKKKQQEAAKSYDAIDAQFELTADEWGRAYNDPDVFNKAAAVAQRNGVPPDGLAEFFATMRRKAKGK